MLTGDFTTRNIRNIRKQISDRLLIPDKFL
jgi:hypothetical protein